MDNGLYLSMLRRVDSVKIVRNDDGTFAVKDRGVVFFRSTPEAYTRIQGSFKKQEDALKFALSLKNDTMNEHEALEFIESRRADE